MVTWRWAAVFLLALAVLFGWPTWCGPAQAREEKRAAPPARGGSAAPQRQPQRQGRTPGVHSPGVQHPGVLHPGVRQPGARHPAGPGVGRHEWSHREFRHFAAHEQRLWQEGRWHYGWHDGRSGWWWGVGELGLLYWYAEPFYPYPPLVSEIVVESPAVVVQPSAAAPLAAPPAKWYWCESLRTYYPYVKECPGGWVETDPDTPPPSAP